MTSNPLRVHHQNSVVYNVIQTDLKICFVVQRECCSTDEEFFSLKCPRLKNYNSQ
ncbi:hypothetical protein Hanom_Chr02g00096251 [Helianthus anomalus]